MVDVIVERKKLELNAHRKFTVQVAQVQAQAMLGTMANLAMEKKAGKNMQSAAAKLDLMKLFWPEEKKEKKKELPSTSSVVMAFGVRGDGQAGVRE